jgi:hypothetical protein
MKGLHRSLRVCQVSLGQEIGIVERHSQFLSRLFLDISLGGNVGFYLTTLFLPYFQYFQMGSLAGAAHLRNDSLGVQRCTQQEQKSCVEEKAK